MCATIDGCVPLDIFGGAGSITPEMLAYIQPVVRDRSDNTLSLASANASGDLFDMPAGPLSMAAGYEYRKYEGSYQPDALTVAGDHNGVPSLPTSGEYDVNEVFAESSVPLLSDSPWAEALDLSLAGRYSDYSTFGGEFTPKYGLRWQLVDEFLIRATFAEGFRAPSIGELYGSASRFDATLSDPCPTGPNGEPPRGAPRTARRWACRPATSSRTRRSRSPPAATRRWSPRPPTASAPASCGARRSWRTRRWPSGSTSR